MEDPDDPIAVCTEVPMPDVDPVEEKRSLLELLRDNVFIAAFPPEVPTVSNLCNDDMLAGSGFSFPSGGSRVSSDNTSTSDVPPIGIPAEFMVNRLWWGRCGGGKGW